MLVRTLLAAIALAGATAAADAQTLCTRATMTDADRRPDRRGNLPLRRHRPLPLHLPAVEHRRRRPASAADRASRRQRQRLADDGGQPRHHRRRRSRRLRRGLPERPAAPPVQRLPCLDNNWAEPDNVFFIAELIGRQKATGLVDEDRVHLAGFSGGAALIYDIVATPGFPHAINSVATVAGAFGLFHADRPDAGFTVTPLQEGTPVSALLVQGGLDDRAAGRRRPRPRPGANPTSRSAPRSTPGASPPAPGPRRRRRSTCSPSTRRRRPTSRPSATPGPAPPSSRSSTPPCRTPGPTGT